MRLDPIYLDYNATTPCDPRVVEKMSPFFTEWYGNPANVLHIQGRRSARAVADAREQIAALIVARPGEIFFTAGATESNNLAILGLARAARRSTRRRIVTASAEHKAVLLPCKKLADDGFEVVILPVDRNGRVDVEAARSAIDTGTLLVSVQAANNEIGTIQPVAEIAALAHEMGAFVHCDAAQAVGKIPVNVDDLGVDLLSASAHKLYGPKGIGCLYVRGGTRTIALEPLAYGGGQENAIAQAELTDEMARLTALRDTLETALLAEIDGLRINARDADRLPNTSSLTFPGVDADALLLNMPKVMLGTGSACTSGAVEPSHVLTAIGLNRAESSSTIRLSLGRFTYQHELREIIALLFQTSATLSD
ncbi:MAG: cysteine desulfurase family protein [Caldilinea sp.]|nr:cysteine desulfurase family protein [Caldilinea sp.]